jgi:uncharacterized protein (TIGR03663 family)
MHHDESMYAIFSLTIAKNGDYSYTPFLHGPLLYYLNALAYLVLPITDFVSRIMPALAGALLILLPAFLQKWMSRWGSIIASLFIALSPTMVYYSRSLRHDIYSEVLHAICLISIVRFTSSKDQRWFLPFAGALALSFANHELIYISIFLLVVYLAWQLITLPEVGFGKVMQWLRVHDAAIIKAGGVAALIYICLFSSFFSNWQGILDGLPNPFSSRTSLGYWLSQHEVKRGGQPIYYYLLLLLAYEFTAGFVLVASLRSLIKQKIHKQPLDHFLIFWFIGSLLIYSWAGERMPWLLMHPLMPLLLLAGRLTAIWIERRRWILLSLFATLMAYNIYTMYQVNFVRSADPREPLVFVQSSAGTKQASEKILALTEQIHRRPAVVVDKELTWPFAWYLRRARIVAYPDNLQAGFEGSLTATDAVLIHMKQPNRKPVINEAFELAGCYSLRDWWVAKLDKMWPSNQENQSRLWRWISRRQVDHGFGTMPFCLYLRSESLAN